MYDLRRIQLSLFASLLLVPLAVLTAADGFVPQIAPASKEPELAMRQFQLPDGFAVDVFAAEPMLANPVAFCIDEYNRVYVCETFRQLRGVEDNRSHTYWLLDDLAAESVADRLAYFREHLGEGVEEYAVADDRIRLIEDTNGDGRADKATVYAEGFNNIEDGTAAGILARRNSVYLTNIPKLYLLRDTDQDGQAEHRSVLADGFGVRVAFRGHDLHGLTIGPDGRLYFSIGDRGYNVETGDGPLARPDTGAVFRCELDGSHLEEFAVGLRNPQELAFDDYGNLFTGDNNSDSGDKARWVYVTPGSDQGWRMYFQYLADRGPWNRERMWYPYRADAETTRLQPAFIVPPIANIGDGPSGLAYNPGVGMPDRYRGHFFLCDFLGTTLKSGIRSFAMKPRGASFELVDSHWFVQSVLATDVDFGYDGRVYLSDWVDGWNGPGKGRLYTLAYEHAAKDEVQSSRQWMAGGMRTADAAQLMKLLSHADRRVRLEAQLRLVERALEEPTGDRGQRIDAALWQAAVNPSAVWEADSELAQLHAIWALGHLMRITGRTYGSLEQLLSSESSEVRAQSLRIAADLRDPPPQWRGAAEALNDDSARVQYFAALAVAKHGDASEVPTLLQLLAENDDRDPVLRHAAVVGLAHVGKDQLSEYVQDDRRAVRLGVLLAMRRNRNPEIVAFLADPDPQLVEEAARAIHDLPIQPGMEALAALLERESDYSDALLRRALNANFRLGGEGHVRRVARIAAMTAIPEDLRLEAIEELLQWEEPSVLDRVTGQYRPIGTDSKPRDSRGLILATTSRSVPGAEAAVREYLSQLLTGSDRVRGQAVRLAAKYKIADAADRLYDLVRDEAERGAVRAEALTALHAVDGTQIAQAIAIGLDDDSADLRIAARSALAERNPERAVGLLDQAIASSETTTAERQAAIAELAKVERPDSAQVLTEWLRRMAADRTRVPAAIQLDLLNAAEADPQLSPLLAEIQENLDPTDPLGAYRVCLEGGDASRGRTIFFGNAAASCRRCHLVNGEGSDVGPDLSEIGKEKDRLYLLQSIITPNAQIAKGYETSVFVMEDGRQYAGIIKSSSDDTFQIQTPQGELVTIIRDEIDFRAEGRSGMPDDVAKPLSKSDIRDLVEYLSQLKQRQAGVEAHGNAE